MRTSILFAILLIIISCANSKKDNNLHGKNETEKLNTISNETGAEYISNNSKHLSSFDLTLGFLRRNLKQDSIVLMLGEPDSIGVEILEGAEGTFVQDWYYLSKGINLVLYSEEKGDQKNICSILISEPCTYKTERGIGIGDKSSEVISVYKEYIDYSISDSTKSMVVGSIYDGMIFSLENGKVNKIFIGSAAE